MRHASSKTSLFFIHGTGEGFHLGPVRSRSPGTVHDSVCELFKWVGAWRERKTPSISHQKRRSIDHCWF